MFYSSMAQLTFLLLALSHEVKYDVSLLQNEWNEATCIHFYQWFHRRETSPVCQVCHNLSKTESNKFWYIHDARINSIKYPTNLDISIKIIL